MNELYISSLKDHEVSKIPSSTSAESNNYSLEKNMHLVHIEEENFELGYFKENDLKYPKNNVFPTLDSAKTFDYL